MPWKNLFQCSLLESVGFCHQFSTTGYAEPRCALPCIPWLDNMADALMIRFGLEMSRSGLCDALKRHGICHKRLTKQDWRTYTPDNVELTRRFLFRRLGLDKEVGVWVDEMLFKGEDVGHNYGYAPAHLRAIQVDDGRGSGDAVMFISAMTDEEVLPISLPVVQLATVSGLVFELWCQHLLISDMLARGKTFVVFDNARVHRKRVLIPLFWAAGIRVIFLPRDTPQVHSEHMSRWPLCASLSCSSSESLE